MSAAILRKRIRSHFVQLPNDTVRDARLSFKAVGILAHIMSLPDGVHLSADFLARGHTDGRDSIQAGLRELTEAGYYRVEKHRQPNGTFRMEVLVSPLPDLDQPEPGFPVPVDDSPEPGFPKSVEPESDNPAPSNKDLERKTIEKEQEPSSSLTLVERDDVEAVCEHLARRITENGSKPPTITKQWRTAARLLIDNDGRTEKQVHNMIDWCQDDEFWRSNILSMPTLRKQYDKMRLKATATARPARETKLNTAIAGFLAKG